ncbi:ATP-dependent nuclease [Pseudomonas anguilliseptica]|uniref:ATP-dependent nuclease n=1 Tax=Pseudomonas anguilliseptica TaxID=53406 RepID=UPI003736B061
MKIKSLTVDGFRCLLGFEVQFEDDLTVIVGENDAGKSSLIECLKVVTQGRKVEKDDFNHNLKQIKIGVCTDEFRFEKIYNLNDDSVVETNLTASPTDEYINNIKNWLDSEDLNLDDPDQQEKIRLTAKTIGLTVRANSNIPNLKTAILEKFNGDDIEIAGATFPSFNNIQLDGRHFENVSGFFKEVFLKGKQSEIWDEKITDDQTIEEFVKEKINSYSSHIEKSIKDTGVLGRMQIFLKDLTEVKIEPIYQKKDLNIDAKVKFMEHGKEVSIDKKGDGTKRRITMALLEYKKEQSLLEHDTTTIYLLDEPDTHLHVKAQIEFLDTIKGFAANGSQVILTTHSPFIINSVKPKKLRLLENRNNHSKIKYIKSEPDSADTILRALGIENTYLFFSRHIIIVEGETEEKFIPSYFIRAFDETLSSSLVKIINCKGIPNIPGFAKALLEIHNPENIHLLYDNDASPELTDLIDRLNIPEERKYVVGTKEFEDAFNDQALYYAWSEYLTSCDKETPETWSVDSIRELREKCAATGAKFSNAIRSLNQGGKKMSKPIFGNAIGQHLNDADIPERLLDLIRAVRQV